MTSILHCTRSREPRCAWTGNGEHALIEHYLAVHHSPSTDAYVGVCDALRGVQHELDAANARLQKAENLIIQARVGFENAMLNVNKDSGVYRAMRHYLRLMDTGR